MTDEIKTFVKAHYPATAFYAVVKFDSEYNDETYDNRVQCLAVYDTNKEEVLPLKACTDKIMELLSGISCGDSMEEREDLVVIL